MSDATVIANARRQAELEARNRDLTKPEVQLGSTGDSLRSVRGMENITDEMLQERATFNLKDHMAKQTAKIEAKTLDLKTLSAEELRGLRDAADQELAQKENG